MHDEYHSKRYEPAVVDLENRNSSHSLIIELTGENKNVLEVGTSTGYMSRILKEMGNTVTGIEIDREAAKIAERYCDSLIIGDIEKLDLDIHLPASSFDVIIFGDVLEHLVHPEEVLVKMKKYLRPDGYLAVSLPNICHGDVIINMLLGNFHYTPMGLLDITHLRFFGLRNIINLFPQCGYAITDMHTTIQPVSYTEQRIDPDMVPDILLAVLKSLPDANVYQYVFRARSSPDSRSLKSVPVPDVLDVF
jgi:2-polyprenyl-3-methyl-5-hydroxy-6-metoxy-1,4-benzoquinol methylase